MRNVTHMTKELARWVSGLAPAAAACIKKRQGGRQDKANAKTGKGGCVMVLGDLRELNAA